MGAAVVREGMKNSVRVALSMAPDGLRLLSALILAQILLGGYAKLLYYGLYTL